MLGRGAIRGVGHRITIDAPSQPTDSATCTESSRRRWVGVTRLGRAIMNVTAPRSRSAHRVGRGGGPDQTDELALAIGEPRPHRAARPGPEPAEILVALRITTSVAPLAWVKSLLKVARSVSLSSGAAGQQPSARLRQRAGGVHMITVCRRAMTRPHPGAGSPGTATAVSGRWRCLRRADEAAARTRWRSSGGARCAPAHRI